MRALIFLISLADKSTSSSLSFPDEVAADSYSVFFFSFGLEASVFSSSGVFDGSSFSSTDSSFFSAAASFLGAYLSGSC